jgi:hypothetical protein
VVFQVRDEQNVKWDVTDSIQVMATLNNAEAATATAPDYNPVQLEQEAWQQCEYIEREVVENIRACGDAQSQVSLRKKRACGEFGWPTLLLCCCAAANIKVPAFLRRSTRLPAQHCLPPWITWTSGSAIRGAQ